MVVEKSEIGLSSERHVFYKQYLNDWEKLAHVKCDK